MPTGRFAPSPTGPLHVGNLRTALLAWLFARSSGSPFLVRVEDLDRAAALEEHVRAHLADLRRWSVATTCSTRRRARCGSSAGWVFRFRRTHMCRWLSASTGSGWPSATARSRGPTSRQLG